MCKSVEDFKLGGYQTLMRMVGSYMELPIVGYAEFSRISGVLSYAQIIGIMDSEEYESHFNSVFERYKERGI